MAVAERTFTDPTAGAIAALTTLGGSKETTTTSTGASQDAINALTGLLGQQQAGASQDGLTAIIQSIFQKGLEQVPGLATTYGQIAGARTGGANSPMQIAMQDMFTKLSQAATQQLSANQTAAANTAGKLADATATKTAVATKAPKSSILQLLPFALANGDKIKKAISPVTDKIGDALGLSNSTASDFPSGGPASAGSFSPSGDQSDAIFNNADISNLGSSVNSVGSSASNGVDASSINSIGDGGSLDDALSSLGGNLNVNDASNAADTATAASDSGSLFDNLGDVLGFHDGGFVSRSAPAHTMTMKPMKMKPAATKAKGYATGGLVAPVTQADPRVNITGDGGSLVRGVTYNDSGLGNLDLLRGITNDTVGDFSINSKSGATKAAVTGISGNASPNNADDRNTGNDSSEDTGTTDGETGPVSAQEGIGLGLSAISAVTGVPIGAIANAVGLTNTSVPTSPISAIAAVVNAIANANTALSPETVDDDVDQAFDISNVVDNSLVSDPDAASVSNANDDSDDGTSSDAGNGNASVGDAGASSDAGNGNGDGGAGDGSGSSDGGSSGGDGGSGGGDFNTGGTVNGPQGKDVIPAYLTDGEFVIKKDSVGRIGLPLLHMLNSNPDAFLGAMQAVTGQGASPGKASPARRSNPERVGTR